MNPAQKARIMAQLIAAYESVNEIETVTPCDQCNYFANGFCAQWSSPVPQEAQATGCNDWQEAIPF